MGDNLTNINQIYSIKGSKFVFLNIRSLPANINVLRSDLEDNDNNIIAVGLCETWLNEKLHDSLFDINGFNLYRYDRHMSKRGGGLVIYVNDNFRVDSVSDIYNISNNDIELYSLKIHLPKQKNFIFTIVYIPPKSNYLHALTLLDECSNLYKEGKSHWVIGGDFNLDYTGKGSRVAEKKALVNFEQRNNLFQLIRRPTRITLKTESLIDLIFTSDHAFVSQAGKIVYNASDHDMIYVIFLKKTVTNTKPDMSFTCRNMKNYKVAQLHHKLSMIDWTPLYQNRNSTECWDTLYEKYLVSLSETAPFIEIKDNSTKEKWVDSLSLSKIRKRDQLRLELHYNPSNGELFKEFKKARNEARQVLNTARQSHIKGKLDENSKNPDKMWSILKNLMPGKKGAKRSKNKQKNYPINLLNDKNEVITDSNDAANYANDYFVNVGSKLAMAIKTDNSAYLSQLEEMTISESPLYEFEPINFKEVKDVVKSIDTAKASNIKDISSKLFKDCALSTIPQLCYLFNLILITCQIPATWKSALVVPLFKGGVEGLISNYRPISLLPVISKIFEKLIHNRMITYILKNQLLCPEQGGFLPGMGTHDTIAKFLHEIYNNINSKDPTIVIFFDLKKAFDTIDHSILLKKFSYFGFLGKTYDLLKNNISERTQSVLLNNTTSNRLITTYGVPQGSTMGPLFFIMYISDLVEHIDHAGIRLYADDTVFYISGKEYDRALLDLNTAASQFWNWCDYNKLTINLTKSKTLLFSNLGRQKHLELKNKLNINIHGTALETVDYYKYLGVILDDKLSVIDHIKYITGIIARKNYILSKVRQFLNLKTALLLFKTCILPYADIGDIFYNSGHKYLLNKLQILQNKSLKIIYGRNTDLSTVELHRLSNLLDLKGRRKLNLLKLAFKMKERGFLQSEAHEVVVKKSMFLRSHNQNRLNVVRSRYAKHEHSFSVLCVKYWNLLPENVKNTDNLKLFCTRVKREMLQNKLNFPE